MEIPHTKGCVAHSDGDVLIHAICDALLGALAMGDIGLHFPDSSAKFKAIDSTLLLAEVLTMVRREGYDVGNVDSTIRAQRPRLRGYIDAMRQRLAEVMGVELGRVSVKALPSGSDLRGSKRAYRQVQWCYYLKTRDR